jgi:hypothetical protein
MKAFRTMLLLGLALVGGADAFTTKKRDKRPAFKYSPAVNNNNESKEVAREEHTSAATGTQSARFAFPPTAAMIQQHYAESAQEEDDVSYGTALVTCVLSLALGFGLGYGT